MLRFRTDKSVEAKIIETPSQSVRSSIQAEPETHPGVRGLAPPVPSASGLCISVRQWPGCLGHWSFQPLDRRGTPDTPEFEAEYQAAISGTARPAKGAPAAGTLAWLIARYRGTTAGRRKQPAQSQTSLPSDEGLRSLAQSTATTVRRCGLPLHWTAVIVKP